MVVNKSLSVEQVEKVTGKKIKVAPVKEVTDAAEAKRLRAKGEVVVYKPAALENETTAVRPLWLYSWKSGDPLDRASNARVIFNVEAEVVLDIWAEHARQCEVRLVEQHHDREDEQGDDRPPAGDDRRAQVVDDAREAADRALPTRGLSEQVGRRCGRGLGREGVEHQLDLTLALLGEVEGPVFHHRPRVRRLEPAERRRRRPARRAAGSGVLAAHQ